MKLASPMMMGSCGVVGGCCAVGVPIAVHFQGDESGKNMSFVKCDITDSKEPVSFKDPTQKALCYKLGSTDNEDHQQIENDNSELSRDLLNLLGVIWSSPNDDWVNTNNVGWKTECLKTENKWKTGSISTGTVVGSCSEDNTETNKGTVFLEVPNAQSVSTNLQVCLSGKDCWTDDIKPDETTTYTSKSATFWKTLNFYKQ